jgi:equilibrative nucleoside transporter 1/2/3
MEFTIRGSINSFSICKFLMVLLLQSFLAGEAASGALTSALRLITKAIFNNSKDGLRKGASKFNTLMLSVETKKLF